MSDQKQGDPRSPHIATGGGAYIEGDVRTDGGDFVGHDKIVYQGPAFPRPDYRREVGYIIADYTRTFVGRQREWNSLARFAGQAAPGYMLVEAPAGYGKTALMAHLIQRHETGRWEGGPSPHLLYFFIRQEGGRHTPEAFLQALNAQLLALLDQPGGVPPDLASLRGQFSQLWARAMGQASANATWLLLVDGLDELAPSAVTIAHLLPADLAPYAHVVVTSRPNPEPLEQVALEHPFKRADVLRLYAFEEAEIRALLQGYGAAQDVASSLTPRVLAMTKGEPLFARFVCQEVVAEGETALARLEESPPTDVETYFLEQLKHLRALAQGQLARDLLGLLVVTLGGIAIEEMAEVLDASAWDTTEAIKPIQRFLLGETKLELMHLQLRKVVESQFGRRDRDRYRQRILDWCRGYQEQGWPLETPDYILAHYAEHLDKAGQREALYALIDKRWMEIKFKHTHSHRAFAEDAVSAIKMAEAETPTNWAQMVRGHLIYATLVSLTREVPRKALAVLTQIGQVDRALDYAMLIPDAEARTEAYRLIGEVLLAQERIEETKQSLRLALAAAEEIEDEFEKYSALKQVTQTIARVENKGGSAQVSNWAPMEVKLKAGERWYGAILAEMALAEALQGMKQRAGETIDQVLAAAEAMIDDESTKVSALSAMALALAYTGNKARAAQILDRALSVADEFKYQWTKVSALNNVALALAQTGERARAVEMFDQLLITAEAMDTLEKTHTLSKVAQALVLAGDRAKAAEVINQMLAAAEAMKGRSILVPILCEVAETLVQMGNINRAAEVANQALLAAEAIENDRVRASDLKDAVRGLASVRDFDRALAVVEVIESEVEKTFALGEVAQSLAQAGQFGRALAMAGTIKTEGYRAATLSKVAWALAETGDRTRACEVASQVLTIAETIRGSNWQKTSALTRVAQVLMQIGLPVRARGVLQNAFNTARLVGRGSMFDTLEHSATVLAGLDQGQTLWRIYEAVVEVDTWWGVSGSK